MNLSPLIHFDLLIYLFAIRPVLCSGPGESLFGKKHDLVIEFSLAEFYLMKPSDIEQCLFCL